MSLDNRLLFTPVQLVTEILNKLLLGMENQKNCGNKQIVYSLRRPGRSESYLRLVGVQTSDKVLVLEFEEDTAEAQCIKPGNVIKESDE